MRQRFLIVLSFAAIAAARLLASQAPADAPRKFEVASVKRNTSGRGGWSLNPLPGGRFSAQNISLRQVVLFAYNLRDFQLANDPRSVTAAPQEAVRTVGAGCGGVIRDLGRITGSGVPIVMLANSLSAVLNNVVTDKALPTTNYQPPTTNKSRRTGRSPC